MCSESVRSKSAIETTRKGLKLLAPEVVYNRHARLFGGKRMTANEHAVSRSDEISTEDSAALRTPRSIRFCDSERGDMEKAVKTCGMTIAELMRRAAVSAAAHKLATDFPTFQPEIAAQVGRIYSSGVDLLSTLKRDAMIREGWEEELERITSSAKESQASIRKEASRPLRSCS